MLKSKIALYQQRIYIINDFISKFDDFMLISLPIAEEVSKFRTYKSPLSAADMNIKFIFKR